MLKRILSIIAVIAVALIASAEFRWGPTVGTNISTFFWKQKLLTTGTRAGMQAGVAGEIMIPGIGFGLDIGLRYNLHGAHCNFGDFKVWNSTGIGNQNVWMHTLEIPLNLKFKWTRLQGFERYLAPFAYGGPVFSFDIATNSQPALEHPAGFVSMQCGLGAEIYEHFQLSAGYYWGISYEIRTVKLDNYSARPRGWTINLTYLF